MYVFTHTTHTQRGRDDANGESNVYMYVCIHTRTHTHTHTHHTHTHTQGVTMRTANLVGHTCLHKV